MKIPSYTNVKSLAIILFLTVSNHSVYVQNETDDNSVRSKVNLNQDWRYAENNTNDINTIEDYEDRVYFQCLDGGKLLKDQGTPNGSEAIGMANGKASIEVIPDGGNRIKVMVLNQNFKGTYLTIEK